MQIATLIEKLQALAAEYGPDTEVRLATQPQWPFEHEIEAVKTSDDIEDNARIELLRRELADAETGDEQYRAELEAELDELEQAQHERPKFVYITEGRQIGYSTTRLWE